MGVFALPLVGFLIGLLLISLGGGGGGLYVGILTAFFDVPPAVAAATSLATIIPTTAIGSFSHWKAGNVNLRLGSIMMSGAVFGAAAGSFASDFVPASFYTKITGTLLLVLGIQMLLAYCSRDGKKKQKMCVVKDRAGRFKALFYGFLGGFMSGMVGVSGTTPIIAGLTVLGCGGLETVGTSVFVLVGISTTGFLMHLGLGNVDWVLVGSLILGTTLGAFLGPVALRHLSREKLEKVLPPLLIVMVLGMGSIVFFK